MVIFGSTGHLVKTKVVPALHNLFQKGQAMPLFFVGRKQWDKADLLRHLELAESEFTEMMDYVQTDFSDDGSALKEQLDAFQETYPQTIFYFALPFSLYAPAFAYLERAGLTAGKFAFEKPFGNDLASSTALHAHLSLHIREDQIYRIDHYLGKEMVDNILTFRFGNSLFEHLWNKEYVDHVQMTFAEEEGVGTRAGYYDGAGAIRDMVQNHVLQVLSLLAMDEPASFAAEDVRSKKVELLSSLGAPESVVVGQYGSIQDRPAYRQELGQESKTETFVAFKTFIHNDRWNGVPFYIRTGKCLAEKYSEINVVLRPSVRFCHPEADANVISLRLDKHRGILIRFNAKTPEKTLKPVTMEFNHLCEFGEYTPLDYETLFKQISKGDQSFFTRWDEVAQSWNFVDKMIGLVGQRNFPNYLPGSQGPAEADELIRRDGREWLKIPRRFIVCNKEGLS